MKIFLIILSVVTVLLISPIIINIKYAEDFNVKLYYLFLSFTLYPQKKQDKKNKTSASKKNIAKEKKNTKKDEQDKLIDFNKIKNERGIDGITELLTDIKNIISHIASKLQSLIYFPKIKIFISVSSETAADTAVKYGYYCAFAYPLLYKIISGFNTRKPVVLIRPNYNKTEDDIRAQIKIAVLPICAIIIFISFLIKLIKFKLKYND